MQSVTKTVVQDSSALAIEISELEMRYGKNQVLSRLNLEVVRGELIVILGNSGGGKSTLLRLIAGLELPKSGKLKIGGVDQSRVLPHKRDVAMVFQDGNGYGHLTVRQNLDLVAKNSSQTDQVDRWIDLLKLRPTLDQKLSQLSGGQSQRVAIGRAMLSDKSIILMDEPLAHLNQALREEIRELISTVHREAKRTIVYVTHDSDEAFYLANRVAVLQLGQIQQLADPWSVYCKPVTREVARLFGQPTIDIVELPSEWFETTKDSATRMMECGFRPHDWTIRRIESIPTDASEFREIGWSMTADEMTLRGAIVGCRWMGSRWFLELDTPSRIRVTCESPAKEQFEQALWAIENSSRASKPTKCIGYLEATIQRSAIQTFADNR